MFNVVEIIKKKKNKIPLSNEEISYVYNGFINKTITDYQMAAFLMAVNFTGYTDDEQYYATKAMIESGKTFDLRVDGQIVVDKHSSGGVGDKVSIILTPLLVALGFYVGKMSGRGLGFTGGTIDKLESLNLNLDFDIKHYKEELLATKLLLTGQSEDMVKADKEIYALRDVIGASDVFDLMVGSIMAKKLALITDYIFLDVKVGEGAFCRNIDEARSLGDKMLKLSRKFNRKTIIHLTNMDKPLGRAIGNGIEVREGMDFLRGKPVSKDLYELITHFAIDILLETGRVSSKEEAMTKIEEVLKNQSAFHVFVNWVKYLKGDYQSLYDDSYFNPKYTLDVISENEGYLSFKKTSELGLISVDLKAGRKVKTDKVDPHAGIYLHKKTNDMVKKGELVASLYSSTPISEEAKKRFLANLQFNKEPKKMQDAILDIMK
ncbi:thymidine phosphorylase [Ureaplasma canigenitalium]|uniref:thymidine phosphorylase n=1 Tax=Ureaplasma canigenitalium TaxID=42092 RepID=UPI0004E0D286|nr:thymidine phosphorylase [Ureaplasma canigenitalium]